MKKCFKCLLEKPLSEFYVHSKMKDGHLNKCKECAKKDSILHRQNNHQRCLEYDKMRSNLPHRVKSRKEYALTEKGRVAFCRGRRLWGKRNKHKVFAHNRVYKAIEKGILERLPCEVCGSEDRINAHHDDYSKPLDVIWFCRTHHLLVHNHMSF